MTNFNPAGAGSLVFAKDGSIEDWTLVNADKQWAPGGLAHQLYEYGPPHGLWNLHSLLDRIGSEDQLALNLPNLVDVTVALPSTAPAPVFILQNISVEPSGSNQPT
jgi:hypothetical protein